MSRDTTRVPRQCSGSGHRNGVSRDIGIACRRSSEWRSATRRRHVEASPCHHCRSRWAVAVRGRPRLRRLPGLDQPRLMARYRVDGEAAFEPLSRAPKTSPGAIPVAAVELVIRLRKQLEDAGLDAGADTIGWHLAHHHGTALSRATINRILVRAGAVTPDPSKRPKSSYLRVRSRDAERDLAVRLHPLPARRRHGRRDPDLAG
jgi:hypothetical protein